MPNVSNSTRFCSSRTHSGEGTSSGYPLLGRRPPPVTPRPTSGRWSQTPIRSRSTPSRTGRSWPEPFRKPPQPAEMGGVCPKSLSWAKKTIRASLSASLPLIEIAVHCQDNLLSLYNVLSKLCFFNGPCCNINGMYEESWPVTMLEELLQRSRLLAEDRIWEN